MLSLCGVCNKLQDSIKIRFGEAVHRFNNRRFFDCHDVLEDIWMDIRGRERLFYQGILHVAVGLYHYENRNYKGSYSQLGKAGQKLKNFLPVYRGVDTRKLLNEAVLFRISAQNQLSNGFLQKRLFNFPLLVWHEADFYQTSVINRL